jgi:DNA-binding GntR family transcriptional regulator
VRALRVLRQDGWIETQQGKGSFVRGRPALAGLESPRTGEQALNRDESRESGDLIEAGPAAPPARVAALLGTVAKDEVLARKRVVRQDGEASELVTWWVPAALADGTDLAGAEPLHGGVRGHLSRRKGIRVDHVLEQVTARHPTSQESKLLGVGKSAPMLAMYVAARDASGGPVLVLEVVMPGDRHELEDAYQVG